MTTVRYITLGLLLTLISCNQTVTTDYSKVILGDWTYIKVPPTIQLNADWSLIPPPPTYGSMLNGYTFFQDSTCEVKLGYFKSIKREGERIRLFLGTKTKYFIDGDSLKIFNLADSVWDGFKIFKIATDTLTFQYNDSTFERYSKAHYKQDDLTTFDQVVVSSSGCYGSCPINNISISKTGQVIYFGDGYNTINGFYKSHIDSNAFSELATRFGKAQIGKLNENYSANWTDDETVTVTFIKDNRIVKTITDYGRKAPTEFYWAYTPVRYMYQSIPLDTISSTPLKYLFYHTSFEFNGQICDLSQSEGFYLWSLLINSERTQKPFTKKYSVKAFSRGTGKPIETDGQYYKLVFQHGVSETYDLGFNFITDNNLTKKFRPKNE